MIWQQLEIMPFANVAPAPDASLHKILEIVNLFFNEMIYSGKLCAIGHACVLTFQEARPGSGWTIFYYMLPYIEDFIKKPFLPNLQI